MTRQVDPFVSVAGILFSSYGLEKYSYATKTHGSTCRITGQWWFYYNITSDEDPRVRITYNLAHGMRMIDLTCRAIVIYMYLFMLFRFYLRYV